MITRCQINGSDRDRASQRPIAPHQPAVLWSLAMAILAGAVSMRALDALLPELAVSFGRSPGTMGAAVTAYAASYSICQLFYGPLGDRAGLLRVITLAAILSALAAVGCALAPSFVWLVAARFAAGGIAAAIGPLALAWVGRETNAGNRSVAIARMTGASIIGGAAGQAGGGIVGATLGWQAAFVLIGLLFAAAGFLLVRAGGHVRNLAPVSLQNDTAGMQRSLLGLLKRRSVRLVVIAVGIEGAAVYLSFTYLSVLLRERFALETSSIGMFVSLFAIGGMVFVAGARWIMSGLSERHRSMLGGSLAAIAFLLLAMVHSLPVAGGALFLLGLGFMLLHNVLQVRATAMAPDAAGTGTSLFAATFFLGQAIGSAAGGWSYDRLGPVTSCCVSAAVIAVLGYVVGCWQDANDAPAVSAG